MDLIKITPNKERVKSILEMTDLLKKRIKIQDTKTMSALIIADYYEIIKELITAILLLDGYKTLSHRDLITYLKKHQLFNHADISILNDLRKLRNRISYEGFSINESYLNRNETNFHNIIKKLGDLIEKELKNT
jgi:hypothetical protein